MYRISESSLFTTVNPLNLIVLFYGEIIIKNYNGYKIKLIQDNKYRPINSKLYL